MTDARRAIPRTDALLADARFADAVARLGTDRVKRAITRAQAEARAGRLGPADVADAALAALPRGGSLRRVLNATGVVIHTNLGRAPLSDAARGAAAAASGYIDLELDLATGQRSSRRGHGALDALLAAVPEAEAALVVNNGAAALSLVTTCLAGGGGGVVVSRGELVEIGAGFRLPDLIASTGVRLVEVGTTNRTRLADYAEAVDDGTAAVLKVHPSNFVVAGFTAAVPVAELATLGPPVVSDIGSGLLRPDPALPDEPSAAAELAAGADLVTASGDKLLGGPQAGIILGRADLVARLARHPLARAFRAGKLVLAALESTLDGTDAPVTRYRRLTADELEPRTRAVADALAAAGHPVEVASAEGRIGGGAAPGVTLPGWALALPEVAAERLRSGEPAVLARVAGGRCLVDLRCIEPTQDADLTTALLAALEPR